jgi:hypothetical protein
MLEVDLEYVLHDTTGSMIAISKGLLGPIPSEQIAIVREVSQNRPAQNAAMG